MAENTMNAANMEAIVADFKKKNADVAKARTSGGAAMGAAIGSIVPGVGTAIGSAVGAAVGYISTLFNKNKQPWSGLEGTDKGNLIDGLAMEAIYVENIVFAEPVKSYIYQRMKTEKIVTSSEEKEFWQKNPWAQNHVLSFVKQYNDTIALVNRIVDFTKVRVEQYETSKNSLIAVNAIFNMKKGQQPTADEANAIKKYVAMMNAVELSKSLKSK